MSRWIGQPTTTRQRGRWIGEPRVGIGLPHSIGDIEEETKALHTEMMTFGQEVQDQLFLQDDAHRGSDTPRPGTPEDKIRLYTKVWRPLVLEWLKFHEEHQDSFWQNLPFSGAWDRVQDFRTRLVRVREEARREKFKIQTPEPTPRNDDLDVKKIAIIAGAGLAGLVALVLVTRR
jgi:hypothetical protein